jgi:hypothetical protein
MLLSRAIISGFVMFGSYIVSNPDPHTVYKAIEGGKSSDTYADRGLNGSTLISRLNYSFGVGTSSQTRVNIRDTQQPILYPPDLVSTVSQGEYCHQNDSQRGVIVPRSGNEQQRLAPQPWCLICRRLCIGNMETGYECSEHYADFGWTCQRASALEKDQVLPIGKKNNPRKMIKEALLRSPPRCYICRLPCVGNLFQGYACPKHFRDHGLTCYGIDGPFSSDFPHSRLVRRKDPESLEISLLSKPQTCIVCDGPCIFDRSGNVICPYHSWIGFTCEARGLHSTIPTAGTNVNLRSKRLASGNIPQGSQKTPRLLAKRFSRPPHCQICERKCYGGPIYGFKCPLHFQDHFACGLPGRYDQNLLEIPGHSVSSIQKRDEAPRCTICSRLCSSTTILGYWCPVHYNYGRTCEHHYKQD